MLHAGQAEFENLPHTLLQAVANLAFAVARIGLPGSGDWRPPLAAAVEQVTRACFWRGTDQRKDCRRRERTERAWQAERLARVLAGEAPL